MRLSEALTSALHESGAGEELRGVLVSAMPDGLLVWSWARAGRPFEADELAELARASAACLASLGAEGRTSTMTLEAEGLQIHSLPFDGVLVAHVVFEGSLLPGMARAAAKQLTQRLRGVIAQGGLMRDDPLRDEMIDRLLMAAPAEVLLDLRERSSLSLADLEWPEALSGSQRAALARSLGRREEADA